MWTRVKNDEQYNDLRYDFKLVEMWLSRIWTQGSKDSKKDTKQDHKIYGK